MKNEKEVLNTENMETVYLNLKDLGSYLDVFEDMLKDIDVFYKKHKGMIGLDEAEYTLFKQRMEVSLEYAYDLREKIEEGKEIDKEELTEITKKIAPLIAITALSRSEYFNTEENKNGIRS